MSRGSTVECTMLGNLREMLLLQRAEGQRRCRIGAAQQPRDSQKSQGQNKGSLREGKCPGKETEGLQVQERPFRLLWELPFPLPISETHPQILVKAESPTTVCLPSSCCVPLRLLICGVQLSVLHLYDHWRIKHTFATVSAMPTAAPGLLQLLIVIKGTDEGKNIGKAARDIGTTQKQERSDGARSWAGTSRDKIIN